MALALALFGVFEKSQFFLLCSQAHNRNMKYKYQNREFWCRGYYVNTIGKDAKKIKEYIQKQLKEVQLGEQLTLDNIDPFTGGKQ